ncbi:MAG: helicase-exonuclease AddAB subunit AddA, partial [Oscillospiraceae bacterium]
AAGSGKTSVLVERLLRILSDNENKVPADRIVVVTFTNDAAAQMKQRLSDAIAKQLESEPDNEWLFSQQALIPSAKISTIHSFCFDLIRENVQSLSVSAGFRIIDDSEEKLITAKAIENVFERLYGEQPELMAKLSDFTCSGARGDSELEKTVLSVYKFIMSLPFPTDFLDSAKRRYEQPFDEKNDPLAKAYTEYVSGQLKSAAALAYYAAEIVPDDGKSKAIQIITGEAHTLETLSERVLDTALTWDERMPPMIKFETCRYPKVEKGSPEEGEINTVKDFRDRYKKIAKDISENVFAADSINDDYKVNAEVIDGISVIVKELIKEIESIKAEKNALGFSDAEQLAVRLLCRKDGSGRVTQTPLARELSEYYKLIMIDEFQDANNTQNTIFRMISHNGTAERGGDNLFVVGDVKQSIYRFRLANPGNFLEVLDSSEPYVKDFKGKNAAVLLNRNFRSSPDVVDFVNDVFENIMSRENGGIDYTETERLEYGANYPEADRTTEIIFSPDSGTNVTDDEENGGESVSAVQAEARAAAAKIKSMLGVEKVFDQGALRPCEPRDFCILLRDRARGQLYADELAAMGIKAVCEETVSYLQSREIAVLVNLLKVIDNPMQDIPLVSVLMSPMFMLDADETAELRLLSEKRDEKLYKTVLKAVEEGSGYSAKGKLCRFCDIFKKLRICAASQSLEKLIVSVYDSTDFLSSMSVYSDGEQKKANLRLLLEYAKSYEQNSSGGLSGFIRYLNDVSENGGDFVRASVVSPADNAVSVKTIHKSKGLEYPFVFLCGTSRRFNLIDCRSRMQINLELGIGFKIQNLESGQLYDSFPRFAISCVNKRESISEEMRLLYVALTRAKERLFITIPDSENTRRRIAECAAQIAADGGNVSAVKAGSMLDWLLAVILTHPDGKRIQNEVDIPTRTAKSRIKISSYEQTAATEEKTEEKKALAQEQSVRKLLDNFNYRYDSGLTDALAKLTITEIAKSESEEVFLRRPDFVADYSKLTAAEIGTATHTFMQYADYASAENSPEAEAERLETLGIISEAERRSLDFTHIKAFFGSELYARMKRSTEIRREQKFLVEISQLGLDGKYGLEYNNNSSMLQGIADCIFYEDGGIVLVDYKTDRVRSEDVLADRYRRQLVLYSAALEKIFHVKVRQAFLYSFSLDKEIEISLT